MLKSATIPLDPWKSEVLVVHGGSEAEFAVLAKSYGLDVPSDTRAIGRVASKAGLVVLWVENLRNFPVLAHEAFHLVVLVLERRGMRLSEKSEEAYTYTMEDFLTKVLDPKLKWREAKP